MLTSGDDKQQQQLGIPSLEDLINLRADLSVPIPQNLTEKNVSIETPETHEINSRQLRFTDTGAHEHLHSNLPPEIMSFSQEPIPTVLSERTRKQHGPDSPFRPREVIRTWVEDIFRRNGNEKLIEFGTSVELAEYIEPNQNNNEEGEWVLTLRKSVPDPNKGAKKNVWWQERFDAVVVATGHYYLPCMPKIPGIVEFDRKYPGKIRHSKYYRGTKDYIGKVILPSYVSNTC